MTGPGRYERTPAIRARARAAVRAALSDPARRRRWIAAMKRAKADPSIRAKIAASVKAALADPAIRARMKRAQALRREREDVQLAQQSADRRILTCLVCSRPVPFKTHLCLRCLKRASLISASTIETNQPRRTR